MRILFFKRRAQLRQIFMGGHKNVYDLHNLTAQAGPQLESYEREKERQRERSQVAQLALCRGTGYSHL